MPRGRKPNPDKRKGYFYETEEKAFVEYLKAESKQDKDEIFNKKLLPAFTKMTESIIRRYKLYPPDEEYQETFDDAISFLMTKVDKFNPDSNFKAYSYCGTIIKNYLIYKINSFIKNRNRNDSYDVMQPEIFENIKYSTYADNRIQFLTELITNTINSIKQMLENAEKHKLTKDEITVGNALVNILQNWDDLVITDGSNKFNKSSVLFLLKEETHMTTKQIRDNMRKYKIAYFDLKEDMLK